MNKVKMLCLVAAFWSVSIANAVEESVLVPASHAQMNCLNLAARTAFNEYKYFSDATHRTFKLMRMDRERRAENSDFIREDGQKLQARILETSASDRFSSLECEKELRMDIIEAARTRLEGLTSEADKESVFVSPFTDLVNLLQR